MTNLLKTAAVAAALMAGVSGSAIAQYACPAGYMYSGGMCRPTGAYAPSNPVSGAVSGEMQGAARGDAAAGPVGAIVGGAIGTATGTLAGTTNAVMGGPVATTGMAPAYGSSVPPTPAPGACAPGYMYYSGACYPAR